MVKLPFDDPEEMLYLRLEESHLEGERVSYIAVRLPDWSTNRGSLSPPEGVLDAVKYPTYTRVGEFNVGSVPRTIEPDPPKGNEEAPTPWEFSVEHDPLPENYAHSEVRANKQGVEFSRKKKPGSAGYQKKIRIELARLIRVRAK